MPNGVPINADAIKGKPNPIDILKD